MPHSPSPTESAAAIRLNKRMADLGYCSRREADAWIEHGWVRVDGQVALVGQRVSPASHISVDAQAHRRQAEQVTILMNKPIGYVSGQAEDGHAPAISLVQASSHWAADRSGLTFHPRQLQGMAPAGRLDIDSTGLLVMTQDGRVARSLIGADSPIEKEYLVRVAPVGAAPARARLGIRGALDGPAASTDVQSTLAPEQLALLRHGMSLDGQPLKPAQVSWQNPQQLCFILTEGKKRQIRRMCELVGLHVVGLKRVRIGRVMLGALPLGQWRYLGPGEYFE